MERDMGDYSGEPQHPLLRGADLVNDDVPAVSLRGLFRDYNASRQETGRWLNNRAENSRLPFRRREREIQRFRQMRSLQKFAAVHTSVHNHFNRERHLYPRDDFKLNRTVALAEWH